MSREKIKVPMKVYEELEALKREIHFTLDHADTIKKAEDRGYMAAATWIRENEHAYKIGFSWGFEPDAYEPQGSLQDIPRPKAQPVKRTVSRSQTIEPRTAKKQESSRSSGGFLSGVKNWLGKYF